jgi:hypothetical protein
VTSSPIPSIIGTPVPGPSRAGTAGRTAEGLEWETWRFLPEKALSRWYPCGPWTVKATARSAGGDTTTAWATFNLRRATELDGMKVTRNGGANVRVSGALLRVDPLGKVDYRPFAGQRITLRFRPTGSEEWRDVGTAVTRKDGWFSARLRGQGEGLWRAEYAGTTRYAAAISAERRL